MWRFRCIMMPPPSRSLTARQTAVKFAGELPLHHLHETSMIMIMMVVLTRGPGPAGGGKRPSFDMTLYPTEPEEEVDPAETEDEREARIAKEKHLRFLMSLFPFHYCVACHKCVSPIEQVGHGGWAPDDVNLSLWYGDLQA